mgnify:CR=1 FL=1
MMKGGEMPVMSRGLRNVPCFRLFRVLRIIIAAILLAAIMPTGSGIGRGESPAEVIIISPPPGLGLPVAQAVEVRYRVVGAAAILELWDGDTRLAADYAPPKQEVAHAWALATTGPHCLTVRALGKENMLLATAELCIVALPRGSPVCLSVEIAGGG